MISGGVYQLLCRPRRTGSALRADRSLLPIGDRGDAALGQPDQEHGPHRHRRHRARRSARSAPATRCCCSTRRRTATSGCSPTRSGSTCAGPRTTTSRSGSVPTSVSVPAWPDSSSPSFSTGCSIACPTLPSSTTRSPRIGLPTSSAVTSACPFASRPADPRDLALDSRFARSATHRCLNLTSMSITVGAV